jgi:aminoglycoside N3'-acetyltransferase
MNTVTTETLIRELLELGVIPGGILLVHTSFSRLKPVEGGPEGLIRALRAALGAEGTLVMPSMSYDDDHAFDKRTSPCPEMGVVADTFWRLPDVLRSDNNHAFAAAGPRAEAILAPHPIELPHGLDSPVGRVYELDGQILLLGVGHDSNTTVHLAENLGGARYRRDKYVTLLRGGRPVRFEYREIDHCCQNFALVDDWLDERGFQRGGRVGHAEARWMRARDVVSVVTEQLGRNETIFLHPEGFDEECDDARASLQFDF